MDTDFMKMQKLIISLMVSALILVCFGWVGTRVGRQIDNAVFHPGFGACNRCDRTWDVVTGHDTPYEWSKPGEMHMLITGQNVAATNIFRDGIPKELAEYLSKPQPTRSCFPLCEGCWLALKTPAARLPYYRALFNQWKKDDPKWRTEEQWKDIESSVLAGN